MATATIGDSTAHHSPLNRLWYRELDHYPSTGGRYGYLALIALASVVLYYELYVTFSVLPLILPYFHMSFLYYMNTQAIAFAFGAFGSLLAGLSDRWGRANLVVAGLAIVAVLVLFAAPNVHAKLSFVIILMAVGFVEGAILVATAAIMRDFSPQIGRASAMGMWAIGPVLGSLVASSVATHTLTHFNNQWQSQFRICGWVGIGMFVIAFLGLRELSPGLRDQAMVSTGDRQLVEQRSSEVDVEAALAHPWRQMVRFDVFVSAFLVSVLLLMYYALVSLSTLYYTTTVPNSAPPHYFTVVQANGINTWAWAIDAGALIAFGMLSDWLKVRKPLMIIGTLLAILFSILFLYRAGRPTGYYELVVLSTCILMSISLAYPAWMAGFTETLERYNPALVATGLALWGWILRGVVAAQTLVIPHIITSTTTLVDNAELGQRAQAIIAANPGLIPRAQSIIAKHGALVSIVQQHQPLFAQLSHYSNPAQIPPALIAQATQAAGGLQNLLAIQQIKPDLLYLQAHQAQLLFLQLHQARLLAVQHAQSLSPSQWQHWWWVCIAGQIAFLGAAFVLVGRWNPRHARADLEAHEAYVIEELARIARGEAGEAAPAPTPS